ncbi:hypothetical protein PL335_16225 (plasmid) [Sulfitobacter faviae]|uniref:hypothetical protein n=1 Tax=Sulfitobacter faviae TaxID=1775881 RepID=UPI0023073AAF|nr:hypothetical protein [Sulfitobacter faviae]WCE68370.1 hypothetical protein PL335_16225 [Sulfitobacter faviae]
MVEYAVATFALSIRRLQFLEKPFWVSLLAGIVLDTSAVMPFFWAICGGGWVGDWRGVAFGESAEGI